MLSFADVLEMARFTLQDPRAGARRAMAMNPPMQARWGLLILVAVVSALLTHLSVGLLPPDLRLIVGQGMASPVLSAGLQIVILLIGVGAIHRIGRARGGTGSFADALLLVGWLQFILLGVQALQVVAQIVAPTVAEVIGIAGIALFLWMLTCFIAELHRFRSLWAVFFGVMASIVVASMLIAMVMVGMTGSGG